ncbi:MAG: hypothetical protein IKA86_04020 [Paraprevotella sp.]|nr:hypothetical protein [Paraprevotella sp.]
MKKFLLGMVGTVFTVFCVTDVNAQESQFKPTKGSFSTELNFTPFENDGNMFSLENGYALKFRYFLNDKNALRLRIGLGMDSKKYNNGASRDMDGDDIDDYFTNTEMKAKWGDFSLDLGYERHFNIHKRISLYAGAQIGIYKHFVSAEGETSSESFYKATYWNDAYTVIQSSSSEYSNMIPSGYEGYGVNADEAYFGVAASIFTGLDFYLYKGLYIGAELGLNINSHKVLEREEKKLTSSYNSLDRKTKTEETEVKYEDELRTTSVRFKVEPAIRLGWTF